MSHDKFYKLLDRAPTRINQFWDRRENVLNEDMLEQELCVMSTGEVHLAQFYSAVWLNNNQQYGFDVVAAMAMLDQDVRDIIAGWISDPFFP